jgi:hypothetical protein
MNSDEKLMTRYGTALALQGNKLDRSPLLTGDVEKPRVDFDLLNWTPPADSETH